MKKRNILFFLSIFFIGKLFAQTQEGAVSPMPAEEQATEQAAVAQPEEIPAQAQTESLAPSTEPPQQEQNAATPNVETAGLGAVPAKAETATPVRAETAVAPVEEQPKEQYGFELSEEGQSLVKPGFKEESVKKYIDEAKKIVNEDIAQIVSQIMKIREDYLKKYQDIHVKVDELLQEKSVLQGKLSEIGEELQQNEAVEAVQQGEAVWATSAEQVPAQPVAPTVQTPTPPPPTQVVVQSSQAQNIFNYQKDIEQLKSDVDSIDQAETKILEQLRQVDEKVNAAVDESVTARKLNMEMLTFTDEAAITSNLNKLEESSKKIESIKNELQSSWVKNMDEALTTIQSQLDKVNQKLSELDQTSKQLQPAEQKKTEVVSIALGKPEATVPKAEVQTKASESYIFRMLVNGVAGTIKFFARLCNGITGIFSKGIEEGKKEIEEHGKIEQQAAQTPAASPVQPTQVVPTQPSNIDIQMKDIEENLKNLEEKRLQIEQQQKELEVLKNKRLEEIKQKLASLEKLGIEVNVEDTSSWHYKIESFFEKCWDLTVGIYQKLIKEPILNFVGAVQTRVKEFEKEKKSVGSEEKSDRSS